MNKRDKIALEAMKAIIGKKPAQNHVKGDSKAFQQVARGAYCYADAMLYERDEPSNFVPETFEDNHHSYFEEVTTTPKKRYTTDAFRHHHETVGPMLMREHPCKGGCEACKGCNASDSQEHFEVVEDGKFKPFTIEILDQGTCNLLAELVGATTYEIDEVFNVVDNNTHKLHDTLFEKASSRAITLDINLCN